MTSALFAPVCSIAPTRRRRFLWAAWWTSAPTATPFCKPDAFAGGARTRAAALLEAERAAGCSLLEIESKWARAWGNVLLNLEPWPFVRARTAAGAPTIRPRSEAEIVSIWQTLGIEPSADVPTIQRAYRQRALIAHPDRGGTALAFRTLQTAYETALKRRTRPQRKPR